MKKILMTALVASMMLVPFGAAAAADQVELPLPAQIADCAPGEAPAEISAAQSMSPALHAALLAMLNHQADSFRTTDPDFAWEALYNMLSLYGQLDERAEYQGESLLMPAEQAADYAAALDLDLPSMGELPRALADRMTYDAASDCYLVVCGNDELSELELQTTPLTGGQLLFTGALVSLEDGAELARFQAAAERTDNLLGCVLVSMDLL